MKLLIILLFLSNLFAAPRVYRILKLHIDSINIDGDISEWHPAYKLDSIRNDNNVYYRTSDEPHDPSTDWNADLYAAFDDIWVYFAVKVTVDDYNISGGNGYEYDNLKINLGEHERSFYIWNNIISQDDSIGNPKLNPSCPFFYDSSLICGIDMAGNNTLPIYEFAIKRDVIDRFMMDLFQLSIGSEDIDSLNDRTFLAFGCEYKDFKHEVMKNPWDNLLYYPTFDISDWDWDPQIENKDYLGKNDILTNNPNPFNQTVTISIPNTHIGKGLIQIYDIRGKMVFHKHVRGQERIDWNAGGLSNGIYLLKARIGEKRYSRKLILQR